MNTLKRLKNIFQIMEKEHIIIFSHKGNNVFPKSELDLAKALDFYSQVDIQQLLSL